MLSEFGPSIYIADGPTINFYGMHLSIRMVVVRLSDGRVWVWSPIPLSDALAQEVEALGPVSYIVSPNKIHHLSMGEWARRWPDARLYASPGLETKEPDLHFHAELQDAPDPGWADDIDQVIFHGSFFMEEVVFFHRASKTAIMADLIERNHPEHRSHLEREVLRIGGVLGKDGTTPIDWRMTFSDHDAARAARKTLLEWKPEQLVVAHGDCARSGATQVIEKALAWI
ncbi:MAG: DUF4336 domain-containing protein [Pseudomonadota bacterium]